MNVRLLLMFFLTMGFTVFRAHAQPVKATVGSFCGMWDSTFRVGEQNVSLAKVPAGITIPAFQRMWALTHPRLSTFTTDASFGGPMTYGRFRDLVSDLVFQAIKRDFFDKTERMITEFKRYGFPRVDSVEAIARGRTFFFIELSDTVSQVVLDTIAAIAPRSPIVMLSSVETTVGDTVTGTLRILNNPTSVLTWRATFSSSSGFANIDSMFGVNGFGVQFQQTNAAPEVYTAGGVRVDEGITLSDFDVARFPVVPSAAGGFAVFMENAGIADSVGDRLAWPHMGRYRSYSRFDVTQDDTITIADAARASFYVLRGIIPPLLRLGDVNSNGFLDPDDVFDILTEALFGDGVPRIVPRVHATAEAAHGVLEVVTSEDSVTGDVTVVLRFTGDCGDAKRLASRVSFNANAFAVSDITFEMPLIPQNISGQYVEGGAVHLLMYPQTMKAGTFVTLELSRKGVGEASISVEPLVGDNLFSFGENVEVKYLTSAPEERGTLPEQFELGQNYPNPFNPGTKIEYVVLLSGSVDLTVYNILGQPVRTLVRDEKAAGRYTAFFDGNDDDGKKLSSGTYFYQIRATGFKETKRMTLIR